MFATFKNLFTQPAIISSAVVTVLLLGIQKLGVLENLELKTYDQMTQMRSDGGLDPRLLIVGVTEEDIRKLSFPLSDKVIDEVLEKLEQYEPRAIGLDIFRDLPVNPGHENLLQRLQQSDIIIPVCKNPDDDGKDPGTPAPKGIEPERVGFVDVIEDTDGIIRRNLLLHQASERCGASYSLSLQLALKYLEVGGIKEKFTPNNELQLRNLIFKPLQSNFGGHKTTDASGNKIYKIMLNYRSGKEIAKKVTITEVLSNQVKADLVKDRIVLIGSTAVSLKDIFNTPYSSGKSDNSGKMAGIEIHAQSVSQILSVVLNKQPLIWFLPFGGEVLWIWGWALIGGLLASRIQHPLWLGLVGGATLAVLFGSNFVIFTQAGWLPLLSPVLGLVVTAGSVLGYSAYHSKQQEQEITQRVQEQKELIDKLQSLLRQSGSGFGMTGENNLGEELPINTILKNRYKINGNLSAGGFSNTYLTQDIQRPGNPECVVKQLRPASIETEYLDILRRLFETEAEILEILGKHPQIPQLLAFFEENQDFYLVQEFIRGNSLTEELIPGQRLIQAEVVRILKQVLQILVFVHSYGVIHRDIKPSNLIRREADGQIVLIDFGAVKQVKPQQQEYQTIAIGTTGYAPSEQMGGLPKLNSDIYALGILGIQALTGMHPSTFRRDANTGAVSIEIQPNINPRSWRELTDTIPELASVLDKMVHLDFNQRYQSATEVLKIMESF